MTCWPCLLINILLLKRSPSNTELFWRGFTDEPKKASTGFPFKATRPPKASSSTHPCRITETSKKFFPFSNLWCSLANVFLLIHLFSKEQSSAFWICMNASKLEMRNFTSSKQVIHPANDTSGKWMSYAGNGVSKILDKERFRERFDAARLITLWRDQIVDCIVRDWACCIEFIGFVVEFTSNWDGSDSKLLLVQDAFPNIWGACRYNKTNAIVWVGGSFEQVTNDEFCRQLSRTAKVCKFRQMLSELTAWEPKSGTAIFLFKSNLNLRRVFSEKGFLCEEIHLSYWTIFVDAMPIVLADCSILKTNVLIRNIVEYNENYFFREMTFRIAHCI